MNKKKFENWNYYINTTICILFIQNFISVIIFYFYSNFCKFYNINFYHKYSVQEEFEHRKKEKELLSEIDPKRYCVEKHLYAMISWKHWKNKRRKKMKEEREWKKGENGRRKWIKEGRKWNRERIKEERGQTVKEGK